MATIAGYAALYSELSENMGGAYVFKETIAVAAFGPALAADRQDIKALLNHDPNFVLGRTGAGTLRLHEDRRGLYAEIDAPETRTIEDLVISPIKRHDLTSWSFAFILGEGGERWETDAGMDVRVLTRISRLLDVSVVSYPAYPAANSITLSMSIPEPRSITTAASQTARPTATRFATGPKTIGELDNLIKARQRTFLATVSVR